MKITELHLTNFSSHAESLIAFSKPITLIVGQLNAGKSSILQAIEYALTGDCGYHRKRTDSRTELVRGAGANGGMEVRVVTDVGTGVRARNGIDNVEAMEWNGMTQATDASMKASVAAATRVTEEVLSALLNTSGFFNLDEAKQKEIIISMVGAEVTDAKVRAAWQGEADALKCLPAGQINSLRALEAAYKYVFERRTIAKRELEELKPPSAPEGIRPDLDRIKGLLAELRKNLSDNQIAKAKLEGAAGAVSGRHALETEATKIKESSTPHDRPDGLMLAMKEQENIATEAGRGAAEVEKELIDLRVILATRQSNIELLSTFNGRCVAGDHACPAPASDMTAALGAQRKLLTTAETSVVDAQKRHATLCQIRDDRTTYNDLNRKFEALAVIINNQTRQNNRLAEIEKELQKPDPKVDSTEINRLTVVIDGDGTDTNPGLKNRIANGEKKLESANLWITREALVANAAAGRKKLETEVRHLEGLCKFLGPKEGVRVQLIDEKINVFMDEIQKHLSPFGYSIELTIDPWAIAINGQPVRRLSASERYRLSTAFQVAMARMTGVNFVICDGSEILTPPVFGSMMKMLSTAGLDQAIVIKTLMVPTAQFLAAVPKSPNMEFFVVTNTDGVSTVEAIS